MLGYGEIPTTVLTTAYNDLACDTNVFGRGNPKRNRRVAAVVLLILGGISGGWMSRVEGGFRIVLWVGGAMKVGLGVGFVFFQEDGGEG